MPVVPYFGTYGRFSATDSAQHPVLFGADTLIGDDLTVRLEQSAKSDTAWLDNRFGACIGALDAATVGQYRLCRAKEWTTHVFLASIYATDKEDGLYWGEVVIIAYPSAYEESFGPFAQGVSEMLSDGIRPSVELQQSSLNEILETNGAWRPSGREPALHPRGSALVKDHHSFNERMVEAARKRNPGCLFVGWAFIVFLVALAVFALMKLFGF